MYRHVHVAVVAQITSRLLSINEQSGRLYSSQVALLDASVSFSFVVSDHMHAMILQW